MRGALRRCALPLALMRTCRRWLGGKGRGDGSASVGEHGGRGSSNSMSRDRCFLHQRTLPSGAKACQCRGASIESEQKWRGGGMLDPWATEGWLRQSAAFSRRAVVGIERASTQPLHVACLKCGGHDMFCLARQAETMVRCYEHPALAARRHLLATRPD